MQSNNCPTLLIIGAGIYQKPLIEYASQHYRVVLAAPAVSDEFAKYADKIHLCDVRDVASILSFAQEEKIDGVITDQTDISVRSVAAVAEQLGLPGIGLETATLFTDKGLMRIKQQELGIPVLPSRVVSDESDAIDFLNFIGSTAIIKPLDNQGSRGVQTVCNASDMHAKFASSKQFSSTGKVLIEKKAQGREFVVEGLVWQGQYKTLICGDTYYFNIPDAFAATMRCFPTSANDDLLTRLKERNNDIITGFGLKQGITHSEYIMDGDEIYLLETAARGGGVFISSDLISLSTGLCTEEFLCNIALDKQPHMPHFDQNLCSCGYMAFYLPDGEVISLDGIDEAQSLPYVHRNLLDQIKIGMINQNHCDKTTRFSIIVSAENREQLAERMQLIRQMLKIQTRTSRGIELPIWQ